MSIDKIFPKGELTITITHTSDQRKTRVSKSRKVSVENAQIMQGLSEREFYHMLLDHLLDEVSVKV